MREVTAGTRDPDACHKRWSPFLPLTPNQRTVMLHTSRLSAATYRSYVIDSHAGIAGIAGINEDLYAEAINQSDGSIGEGGSGKSQPGDVEMPTHRWSLAGSGAQDPKDGDILIEYHPYSGKNSCLLSSNEYLETLDPGDTDPTEVEPWCPFASQEDFDFAELVHDAKLDQTQIQNFMNLIQRCQGDLGSFTFRKYSDLQSKMEDTSKLLTKVTTFIF